MTDGLDTLRPEVRETMTLDQRWADAQRNERRATHAEANYWFGQYKLMAKDAITERNSAQAELAATHAEMDQLRADAETGKAWRTNNSLEEWFPITAAELKHVKAELAALRARIGGAKRVSLDAYPAHGPGYVMIVKEPKKDDKVFRLLVEDNVTSNQ